jgi:hypothetical protein
MLYLGLTPLRREFAMLERAKAVLPKGKQSRMIAVSGLSIVVSQSLTKLRTNR